MLTWVSHGGKAAKGMERFTRCLSSTHMNDHELSWQLTAILFLFHQSPKQLEPPTLHLFLKKLIYHFTWVM